MKKVLFLTPSLGMGGMERVLVSYANLFAKHGYDVTVKNFTYDDQTIVSGFDPAVHYEKNYHPVKNLFHASFKEILHGSFRLLSWSRWLKFHSARYLYKKYVTEHYDVEIAFFGGETIKIISGSTNEHSARFGWIHNVNPEDDIPPLGSLKNAKKVYSEIGTLICVSEASKSRIAEVFGRTQNVFVVYNPNDEEKIVSLAKERVERSNRLTFVTVGRVVNKEKGFDRLLRAVDALNQMNYSFDLWIVGDGADYQKLAKIKEDLNLTNVSLCGYSDNPYKYINAADVFVCSSLIEGYSLVVAEAFLLNKPVISTRCAGPVELLGNGNFGLLVENSEEGITEGLKQFLDNPDLVGYYKQKATERRAFFDSETIFKEIERIIV